MEKLFSLHRHFKGRKTILRQSPYSIEKKIAGIHELEYMSHEESTLRMKVIKKWKSKIRKADYQKICVEKRGT